MLGVLASIGKEQVRSRIPKASDFRQGVGEESDLGQRVCRMMHFEVDGEKKPIALEARKKCYPGPSIMSQKYRSKTDVTSGAKAPCFEPTCAEAEAPAS